MARIILILAICGFVGCASNGNVVSVRQIESDKPVVLRMRKDRTFIHSLLYPLSFEFKKNDKKRYIILNPLTLLNMMNYVLELANVG